MIIIYQHNNINIIFFQEMDSWRQKMPNFKGIVSNEHEPNILQWLISCSAVISNGTSHITVSLRLFACDMTWCILFWFASSLCLDNHLLTRLHISFPDSGPALIRSTGCWGCILVIHQIPSATLDPHLSSGSSAPWHSTNMHMLACIHISWFEQIKATCCTH